MAIIKWRIFCNTENIFVEGFLDSESGPPTVCFNNNTHTVNLNSQQELNSVQLLEVKVLQEESPTGGNYTSEGFKMFIPANATQNFPIRWPFPVTTILVHLQPMPQNLGDVVNAVLSPMSNIGIITSNINIGSTTAVVNTTVITYSTIGFNFYIGSESLGRITSINTTSKVITFEIPTAILHTANELVYTDYTIIRNLNLGLPNGNDLGLGSISGKALPTNTVTNVIYKNNGNVDKTFHFMIEYMF